MSDNRAKTAALQLRVTELETENADMIAVITAFTAFELWLGADSRGEDCDLEKYITSIVDDWREHEAMDHLHVDIVDKLNAFKAQYTSSAEKETE